MTAQLPPAVLPDAVGVLMYSVICLLSSLFLLWLVWTHNERLSYVSMLAFFTSLSTLASIVQQCHTIRQWRDIKLEQFRYSNVHVGNPEIAIAGASYDMDLVLFYIQFYSYNVEAMLTLFWAIALANSVFHTSVVNRVRKHVNTIAKSSAVLLPAVQVSLLRSKVLQSSTVAFLILANIIMVLSLMTVIILLVAILFKYIYTRSAMLSWHVGYGHCSGATGDGSISLDTSNGREHGQGIHDRWLVVRFTIAFITLGIFQLAMILFELGAARANVAAYLATSADLSDARARSDFCLFLPGVTPSLVTFIVFGTTKPFLQLMWRTCVPEAIKAKMQSRPPSVVSRMPGVPTTATPMPTPMPTSFPDRPLGTPTGTRGDFDLDDLMPSPRGTKREEDEWPIMSTSAKGRL